MLVVTRIKENFTYVLKLGEFFVIEQDWSTALQIVLLIFL